MGCLNMFSSSDCKQTEKGREISTGSHVKLTIRLFLTAHAWIVTGERPSNGFESIYKWMILFDGLGIWWKIFPWDNPDNKM